MKMNIERRRRRIRRVDRRSEAEEKVNMAGEWKRKCETKTRRKKNSTRIKWKKEEETKWKKKSDKKSGKAKRRRKENQGVNKN